MKKIGLITMSDPVHVDTEWDMEDGHDPAVEQTPQLSEVPDEQEHEQEQEWVPHREREENEREMEREMSGRSCRAMRNPKWSRSPNHHDHDAVESGSVPLETFI